LRNEFDSLNAVVLGVSKDSLESHRKFIEQRGIEIALLSDTDRKVLEAYGAWQLKTMYGKESWGVVRSTVLIDPGGKVAKVWPKVAKAAGHAAKVLEEFRKMVG
jgi:peroxiredoxin Q/BCP